jgi:GTP pyrophosphokinase
LEILENAAEPQEFLEHTKLELHRDRVFCFTPKGDLIELPRGATPVDFAYEVHSQVGDTTVGAKVNGKIVPLRHALENGDQVEIITARGGTPNPGWERFVVTGKARARIRRVNHARQRSEQREEGRSAIAKAFRAAGLDFSEKLAEPAIKPLKQADFEAMCVAVATGNLSPRDVLHTAVPELRSAARGADPLPLARPRGRLGAGPTLMPGKAERPSAAKRDAAMGVKGLVTGMAVSFAGCCHPLPGDRILGIVTTGRGVTIHRQDCHGLQAFAATPERFIDVDWDYEGANKGAHVARVELVAENRPDALAGVTTAIARQEGAVNSLRITNRAAEWCEVMVDVEVRDISHLTAVLAALRACPGITQVERGKG